MERLRDLREAALSAAGEGEEPDAVVLGAADPAQPYGAAVPWPKREGGRAPSRSFGAQVVLLDGEPVLYLERGGRSLVTLRDPDPSWARPALAALAAWVLADRSRRAAVERIDGAPALESELGPLLREAGFKQGLRDLVLRAT